MTCTQSKCKYPVTCDYNSNCMDKLVVEANKRRKMNYKQAIKIVLELAQKEIDNNEATYDVPNLVKDGTSVNLEKAEEAFEVVEEEIENLPY
jgi:hypothetical protein